MVRRVRVRRVDNTNWIQKAVKRPNRVRRYLKRRYGDEAFTKDGEIKVTYVRKAITDLKKRPPSRRPKGMLSALYLALRLKKYAEKR